MKSSITSITLETRNAYVIYFKNILSILCVRVCPNIFGKPSSIEGSQGYLFKGLFMVLTVWQMKATRKVDFGRHEEVFMHFFPVVVGVLGAAKIVSASA